MFENNGGGSSLKPTGRDIIAGLVGVAAAIAWGRYTEAGARTMVKTAIAHDTANPKSTALEGALAEKGFALVPIAQAAKAASEPAPVKQLTRSVRTRAGSMLVASHLTS